MDRSKPPGSSVHWRHKLHEVIFEADTPAGRAFDMALLASIALSVIVVVLESVATIQARYGPLLFIIELFFTLLFTIEYILRLVSLRQPLRYAASFYGLVDLLAILPTYLFVLAPGLHYFLVIRILRLLRIFRVLKLGEYLSEADLLWRALVASSRKIIVFLLTVLTLVVIIGALMYVIEGAESGFTSIPASIYWAIVTLTTVGYGDIAPRTPLGQIVASGVMLMGYGIIAVPTGIVTVELSRAARAPVSTQACPVCGAEGHDSDAVFCKICGSRL